MLLQNFLYLIARILGFDLGLNKLIIIQIITKHIKGCSLYRDFDEGYLLD